MQAGKTSDGRKEFGMKKITAIVRPEKLEPLKEALFAAQVSGMTISQVQGCGSQHGWKEYYRGTEVLLNMVPKIKFEIVVDDERVDALVDLVSTVARTGEGWQDLHLPRRAGDPHPHWRAGDARRMTPALHQVRTIPEKPRYPKLNDI